jgi:pyrimidine deaminase RibD-like protein
VRETPEAGIPLCCVRQPHGECEGRNTVIVVHLCAGGAAMSTPAAPPMLLARYHNRGKDHHAERVMMEDPTLLRAIRAFRVATASAGPPGQPGSASDPSTQSPPAHAGLQSPPPCAATLTMYISLQPCHHSSSTTQISCTSDLQRWHRHELQPRGIALDLAIAYPYRSHWRPELMTQDELLELGARSLWGPRYHSKGSCSDRTVRGSPESRMAGARD